MSREPKAPPPATAVSILLRGTPAWNAGFNEGVREGARQGVDQFVRMLEERLGKDEADRILAKAFPPKPLGSKFWEKLIMGDSLTGETPAQKSARQRRTQRILRDEEQATELAALVREGHTTESARQKMGIGVVRAQRIRAVAVRLGLIEGRRKS